MPECDHLDSRLQEATVVVADRGQTRSYLVDGAWPHLHSSTDENSCHNQHAGRYSTADNAKQQHTAKNRGVL
jgi:hypothetical protein